MSAAGIGAAVRRREDRRHETTFAQVVSDRLGIPIENVSVVRGDTDKVQFSMDSYGSRSGAVGISAIAKALDTLEAKDKKVAAQIPEAARETGECEIVAWTAVDDFGLVVNR